MKESYTLIINKGLKLYFDRAYDTFEVIVGAYTPNPPHPSTEVYTKIWKIDLKGADQAAEMIRNSLEEPPLGQGPFIPDYSVFSVKKLSDTVFRLRIYTLGGNSFWTCLTGDQVEELLTIMEHIHATLAKEQE